MLLELYRVTNLQSGHCGCETKYQKTLVESAQISESLDVYLAKTYGSIEHAMAYVKQTYGNGHYLVVLDGTTMAPIFEIKD